MDVSKLSTDLGENHDSATVTGLTLTTKPALKSIKEHGTKMTALTNFTTTDGIGTRGGRRSIAGGEIKPVRADGFEPDGYSADHDEVTECGLTHKKPECEEERNSPK